MTKEDVRNFLVEEAEYDREEVERMDSYDLFRYWLQWHGICGYQDDILDVVQAVFNNMDEIREELFYS